MIRPIVLWGSEVLEKPSEPVTNITDAEMKLVQDMIETMYKAPGVGLAAPQIGIGKRIMVTDTTSGEKKDTRAVLRKYTVAELYDLVLDVARAELSADDYARFARALAERLLS